jgi:hypothetical protein
MNAPFRQRDLVAGTTTLHLFAVFHLNLAFSSIEEEQRGEVIERCYWPLLNLAEKHGPIGIEATGFTLEEIAKRDPEWIGRARALIAAKKIELIGSGYAQMIGPLVPARVTEENLKIANEIYRNLLGVQPTVALINEQAYSSGLVGLYLDAGYRAILMDWDNPGAQHPSWPAETRYRPQRALGNDGRTIDLLWTSTVAFQKLQRFVHGDIDARDYLGYLRERCGEKDRVFCVYASDAEIFDFRPGRYKSEEKIVEGAEWRSMAQAFARIANEPGFSLITPSQVLSSRKFGAAQPIALETAACPVPVKKQRKYTLARWAVTGRDDIAVNAACQRIYDGMRTSTAADWKELCYLWSSDFRTHVTEKRWTGFCERLNAAEARWAKSEASVAVAPQGGSVESRYIDIEMPTLRARLDRRRGLAIESLQFTGQCQPVIGGLRHGHFDDIALQADWYTGDCVFEAAGEHKITDLEWCAARIWKNVDGDTVVHGRIETPRGPIQKTLTFFAREPRVDFDLTFDWEKWDRGSLRLGHITLLPDAFDWAKLSLTTHNGGKTPETFSLNGQSVDHGAAVSFLVSSSYGIGMTEGWTELGDDETRVRVTVDRATAPLLGLLTHRETGGSLFCQLQLSALELDETRKPSPYKEGPRRFRFGICAA